MERGNDYSRRRFLKKAGALGCWVAGMTAKNAGAAEVPSSMMSLSEHLFVYRGPINVGIIRDGGKALLIDAGDGSVADVLPTLGMTAVDRILFTHHHRDQACGTGRVAAAKTRISVPAAERDCFDKVTDYWNDAARLNNEYNFHPHRLMLTESLRVGSSVNPGEVIRWGKAGIQVLSTPGHTDGSVSYLVEVDGRRAMFTGDVIYDAGKIWSIHAMQKGFARGETSIPDYHGFMGTLPDLLASLERIKSARPDVLVPSHGKILTDPPRAIDLLVQRLNTCYDKYVSISALRHYFPALFTEFAGRPGHMAYDKGSAPPEFLRHINTSWLVVSQDGPALMMDCRNAEVIADVRRLIDTKQITSVEGLWVTHYHADHTDAIPQGREAFKCPVIADASVANVITQPYAWRIPCVSRNTAVVDRVTKDGESWQWHEFKLTAYRFPGQTLHHGALLVEGRGVRMLFVGDSFTPAGIDDYCSYNRNWLGRGVGFDYCLSVVEKLRPTHLFNCHVDNAFTFTPEQIRFMRTSLAEREPMFAEIVAWDHANYAMDESWVRCFPYEQRVTPGKKVEVRLIVTNHSGKPRQFTARLNLPQTWSLSATTGHAATPDRRPEATGWKATTIPAKTDGELLFKLDIPPNLVTGRHVLTADIRYDDRVLPQFTEGILVS
jgi:glyoxylase-like metal-dependent hydrolase (beta-lactamase superfamily II)